MLQEEERFLQKLQHPLDPLPDFDSTKVQSRFMEEMQACTFDSRAELREANEIVGGMLKKIKEPPKTRPPIMPRRSFYMPTEDDFDNESTSTDRTGSST